MAAVTDKFKKYSDGSDAPTVARVASPRSAAGTTLACDDLSAWATDTAVNFATWELNTANEVVSDSITYWVGVVSGNNLTNVTRVKGAADGGNAVNDVVAQIPDSDRFDDLVDGLLVSLDQDGTLKAGAVDNSAAIADGVVTTAKIDDSSVTSEKLGATIAFSAYRNGGGFATTSGADTAIVFDTEQYDLGSDFDTATGLFTVPVDGVYHFDASAAISSGDGKETMVKLFVNGTTQKVMGAQIAGASDTTTYVTGSTGIKLTAADTVGVYFYHDYGSVRNLITGSGVTYFNGHLVGRT